MNSECRIGGPPRAGCALLRALAGVELSSGEMKILFTKWFQACIHDTGIKEHSLVALDLPQGRIDPLGRAFAISFLAESGDIC